MDIQKLLSEVYDEVRPALGSGAVSSTIPALRDVNPHRFGLAAATLASEVYGVGDWRAPFSIQSVSKLFSVALVLARDGEQLWKRVGYRPSSHRYDALTELDDAGGVPANPFVNAGALVVVDRLLRLTGNAQRTVLKLLRAETGNPRIDVDVTVAASERAHHHRNAAIAHLIADHGNLHHPIPEVLDHYAAQCAIAMSCADLAVAGLFLARHGVRADGSRLLTRSEAKRLNAMLLTCGTYDAAGDFAYHVGLPAKSGIGGGILAVVPGWGALATWGPALDAAGNSIAGRAALARFTTATGRSVF